MHYIYIYIFLESLIYTPLGIYVYIKILLTQSLSVKRQHVKLKKLKTNISGTAVKSKQKNMKILRAVQNGKILSSQTR